MRKPWVKLSLCIHPDRWHAWLDPGGVPFITSCFVYFLGNTSNGGIKRPVGLIQVMTVTRDPRSTDWKEDIWRLPFSHNIFVCLCCTVVLLDYVEWCTKRVRRFEKQLLSVKNFSGCNWNFLMTTWEIFQPLPSNLFISLAKLVFNSVTYASR